MELWVGPAIVAALVSGLVSAAGWFVTSWQQIRLERLRRHEKVRDFQVALRAEIASDHLALDVVDLPAFLEDIKLKYAADPLYSVVVPHLASNVVFDVVVKEIQILPREVIGVVVNYARFRQIVERFIGDMRSDTFRSLSAQRQLTMYADYLTMLDRLGALAEQAVAALDQSLSSPDADQPSPASASGPDGARSPASSDWRGEP